MRYNQAKVTSDSPIPIGIGERYGMGSNSHRPPVRKGGHDPVSPVMSAFAHFDLRRDVGQLEKGGVICDLLKLCRMAVTIPGALPWQRS
jgi:hypothetical protein